MAIIELKVAVFAILAGEGCSEAGWRMRKELNSREHVGG
jgi:hypothetical protein